MIGVVGGGLDLFGESVELLLDLVDLLIVRCGEVASAGVIFLCSCGVDVLLGVGLAILCSWCLRSC